MRNGVIAFTVLLLGVLCVFQFSKLDAIDASAIFITTLIGVAASLVTAFVVLRNRQR